MAQDGSEIIAFGGCTVSINGTDVGHVDERGATAKVSTEFWKAYVARYGKKAAVQMGIAGQAIEVEFFLSQSAFAKLQAALPGGTIVTSGGNSKLTFGLLSGEVVTGVPLILKSDITTLTPKWDLTIPRAINIGDFELIYNGGKEQVWHCKFEALINEATGADGSYLFTLGDASISPDVTAPTVSSISPVSGATGVSVATTVTWTMSEDIDPTTAIGANVKLYKDPAGTPVEVVGTVSMPAANQIRFTPSSNLAALTLHLSVLETGIKDKAGNAIAVAYAKLFTTA